MDAFLAYGYYIALTMTNNKQLARSLRNHCTGRIGFIYARLHSRRACSKVNLASSYLFAFLLYKVLFYFYLKKSQVQMFLTTLGASSPICALMLHG